MGQQHNVPSSVSYRNIKSIKYFSSNIINSMESSDLGFLKMKTHSWSQNIILLFHY